MSLIRKLLLKSFYKHFNVQKKILTCCHLSRPLQHCTCLLLRRYLHRFSPVADVDVIQAAHIVTGLVSICTVPPHLAPGRRCYIKTPEDCEKYKCTV